jgi:23S rRNA pseudouridine1911/1915/1917 synthase
MSEYSLVVDETQDGLRLDALLSVTFEISRTKVASDIDAGSVLVNDKLALKSHRVVPGDKIVYNPIIKAAINPADQVTKIPILFADEDIVVIDKPVGCAAHPSPGWMGPTVVGALTAAGYTISTSGPAERAGIVHRLDVGTSGLMIVAKTDRAYTTLKDAFRNHEVEKTYHALVQGHMDPVSGTIDAPIDRHPKEDHRFAVVATGKESITHYEVIEFYRSVSLVKVELETGRTHQIRVHFSALNHPLVGDTTYGADPVLGKSLGMSRPWLHALELRFDHPVTKQPLVLKAPYAPDLQACLALLSEAVLP